MREPDAAAGPVRRGEPGFAYVLCMTTLAQAGLSWSLFVFPPIAVEVAAEIGVDPVYVGYQVGIVFLTTIVATLYSGALIERIGPARSIQLALSVCLLGTALCASGSVVGIALGSMCFGLSHSVVNPGTAVILRKKVSSRNRGFVFSIKQTSVPLGLMASSFFGPFLVEGNDWRLALLPLAIVLVALFAAVAPLHVRRRQPRRMRREGIVAIPMRSLGALFSNRSLTLMAIAGMSFGICQGSVMTFTGNLFADEFGHSLRTAGLVLMFMLLGGIVGRLSWGFLADRLQNPVLVLRCIAAMIVVMSIAIAVMPSSAPLPAWIALFLVVGFSAVGWNGLLISEFAQLGRGDDVERQMSGAFFLLFCGGALSPLLFTQAHALLGSYATTIGAFGVFFGLMAMAFVRNAPEVPEHHHPPTPMEQDA